MGAAAAETDIARQREAGHWRITREADRDQLAIDLVPVSMIRPEDGLGRKRDRDGHEELRRSIERFGVLTPVTVRRAPDESGEYLLVKGQGRTLACRMLGMEKIPAIILGTDSSQSEKVQHFLVENIARLKMRPNERAILIYKARQDGEETAEIARRFAITASTVRRLVAQIDGAGTNEIAALRRGELTLATQTVVHRKVQPSDRPAVIDILRHHSVTAREFEALLEAFDWDGLVELGEAHQNERLALLGWACAGLSSTSGGTIKDRLRHIAADFPESFDGNATLTQPVAL